MLLSGCPGEGPRRMRPVSRPSVALRVLVVNDAPLAEAIERLRGEWAERSGGSLSASSVAWTDLLAAKEPEADVVIFPSRYLGELCERKWLRPVRGNVLDSNEYNVSDILPLVRQRLVVYDNEVMAVPLGIHLPMKGSARRDAFRFLAIAAPYAVHRDQVGVLFDPETMKPRIAEPPFVRALEELQRPPADIDKTAVYGSRDVYNASAGRWERRDQARRIPLLGIVDRLAAATTSSRNAASAFKLLEWLASPEVSTQLAAAGDGTLPVRRSLASSRRWYDERLTADERGDFAKVLQESLSSDECLLVPRIPGIDQYLAALDEAIENVLRDNSEPEVALQNAAATWEQITDRLGRDAQRAAYVKHLGIDDYGE